MANRTINTGDDVEAALTYLAKEKKSTADNFFMEKLKEVTDSLLKEADEKRFAAANQIMAGKDEAGVKVSKLRELLNG